MCVLIQTGAILAIVSGMLGMAAARKEYYRESGALNLKNACVVT
jgi:hypothetical protein